MRPPADARLDGRADAVRRVAGNSIYMAVAEAASKAMVFVFFIVAARHLGTERFGVFSLALAYVTMFSVLTDLGLGVVTAREVACNRNVAHAYVGNSLTLKLVSAVLLAVAVTVFVKLLGYPVATVRVTAICSLFIPTWAVALYYSFVFQGFERMVYVAWARIIQTGTLIAGALFLSRGQPVVARYAWLYVVAGALSAIVSCIASTRFVRSGLRFDWRWWGSLLRSSFPVGLAAVLSMFYYWNGSAFLSKMYGNSSVGLYNAPFRLVMGMAFVAAAFSAAIYPVMSRIHSQAPHRLKEITTRSLRYMILCAVPVAVVGAVMARPLVLVLYGLQYEGSVRLLQVLVWWGALIYPNAILSNYFYAVNRSRVVAIQTALSLAVNIAGNIIMIRPWGAMGAACAIVLAEVVGFGYMAHQQRRTETRVEVRPLFNTMMRALAASSVAAGIAWIFIRLHPIAGLVAAPIGYVLLVFGFHVLDREDIALIRMVLARDAEQ
jgi:O-antigen/teichoic acid export membrane protein